MRYIPAFIIGEIVIVALLWCYKDGINGNDFWWHIKIGEWIMENGKIPTHWMNTEDAEKNFCFNCMFHTCRTLEMMAEYQDTEL